MTKRYSSNHFRVLLERLFQEVMAGRLRRQVVIVGGERVRRSVAEFFVERTGVAFGFKILDLFAALELLGDERRPRPMEGILALDIVVEEGVDFGMALWRSHRMYHGTERGEYGKRWAFPEEWTADLTRADVHLFGVPWLLPQVRRLFVCQPVKVYHFSPSQEFWLDEGAHVLLSRYGKVGKEMFDFFYEDSVEEEEGYVERDNSTLLGSVQNDLCFLREEVWQGEDRSLLFLKESTLLGEVRALRAALSEQLALDPTLTLSDCLVLMPDIEVYAPILRFVFADVGYEMYGLSLAGASGYVQAFLYLLSLRKKRWTKEELLRLLNFPEIVGKLGLDAEEAGKLKRWCRKLRVAWGFDSIHRDAFLSQGGAERQAQERTDAGTWSAALKALTLAIAVPTEELFIDFTEAECVGKFAVLVEMLRQDLTFFDTATLSFKGWQKVLREFQEKYLVERSDGIAALGKSIDALALIPQEKEAIFDPVAAYLERELTRGNGQLLHGQGGLVFAPLRAGNVPEKKVIALLGLDEETFPRKSDVVGMHLAEQDHFAALEALCGASQTLILSYCDTDGTDQQKRAPALFYEDLKHYVEKKGAMLTPCTGKEERVPYVETRNAPVLAPQPLPDSVQLKDLLGLVRHPIRFFCQKGLGIYLKEQSDELYREFELSSLDKALLTRGDWNEDVLPLGPFRERAYAELTEKRSVLEEAFATLDLSADALFSLHLHRHCDKAVQKGKVWFLPALHVTYGERTLLIEGEGGPFTAKGPLSYGEKNLAEGIKLWPLILLWEAVVFPNKKAKGCFFLRKPQFMPVGALDWQVELAKLLSFYERALTSAPPFHPQLAKQLFAMQKIPKRFNLGYSDPYLEWLARHAMPFDPSWPSFIQETFVQCANLIV